jgi:hypothetical protein
MYMCLFPVNDFKINYRFHQAGQRTSERAGIRHGCGGVQAGARRPAGQVRRRRPARGRRQRRRQLGQRQRRPRPGDGGRRRRPRRRRSPH